MIETRYYCDWCNKDQESADSMREMNFLITTDSVCHKCCGKVAKLRKEIEKDAKRGKDE